MKKHTNGGKWLMNPLHNKSTNAVKSNSNIFKMFQTTVRVRQSRTLSPSPFNIFLEQTKTNALDKGMTLKMWCYTTGGNNLEHTVTNEAVKQRIWYLICVYATLLESFVGRNFNGWTMHTNRKHGLLAHGVMHGMSEESEERWEELDRTILQTGQWLVSYDVWEMRKFKSDREDSDVIKVSKRPIKAR